MPAQFGVFLPDVELFDAELFSTMRTEAVTMDPQQRLLLHAAYAALSCAGAGGPAAAFGRAVGAYVGIAATDYESLSHSQGVSISSFSFTAASPSVASGRIAYAFGLRGPTASVDTACSASLVAAHMACLGFRDGRMEAALAAGVLLCLVPESTLMLTRATMLSPEGRSKTLDASADGYVRGETCRAMFLRPAAGDAQQAQLALGLLLSSAVNTNGRASSLTAPNGPAQQALLREALATAGVRSADVAGLQMHSNGTALGDPIEVGAAAAVYLEGAPKQRRPFLFATVKGFTGHQESGAGAAGLQAASVLVQAAAVPAALHLRNLNPHVFGALAGHAVSIARGGPYGVPAGQPGSSALMVGVSSFGAQGTNAHALMAGSGAAAVIGAAEAGQTAWRRSRCYVAPAVQQLLSGCVLRGGKRGGRPSSVTFDSQLSAARLAYLWQYSMHGRPFLAGSALLSMAASMLPLLGAVAAGEDATSAATFAGVTEAALVAPAQLPQAAAAKVAPAAARAKLVLGSGAVEVSLADQRLLTAKLASMSAANLEAATTAHSSNSDRAVLSLVAARAAAGISRTAASAGAVAQLAPLSTAEVSGYALHPVLLDASLGQAAGVAAAAVAPLTWLRSVAALRVGASSPAGGIVAAAYQPSENWHVGGTNLLPASGTALALVAHGVVLGDQDLPPASPGPASARLHAAAAAEAAAAEAAEAAEEEAGIPADHPLLQMPEEERLMHLEAQVMAEVRAMLGHAVHPEEPLMMAGLDSRGGMELRRTLAESLGMQLPVTLLYDYQSVSAVVEYMNGALAAGAAAAAEAGERGVRAGSEEGSDVEDITGSVSRQAAGQASAAGAAGDKPSELLKMLRPPQAPRPMFLAAPGVANAQSAYFSFSQFLQWSTQPIYVLDKDNDLDVTALALANAADIVRVQPEGPYLVGGHSYGGTVAMQIAMVLESWGKEVGLVMVMDTPRPDQVRPAQPEAQAATEEDSLELMEMILGALGRDALGMGSSIAHPRESEEWKGMSLEQKFEFFAPIWRVMRDSNMGVEEVRQQVEYVALVTKQASSVSDLRRFNWLAPSIKAPVVYFRAANPGVCTYMDDSRSDPLPHGACWYDLCEDCEVIDIPGDHFSILRQDLGDMNLIVTALKQKLAPFGWTETVRRGGDARGYAVSAAELQDIDSYLAKMGVKDANLRRRLETALPYTDQAALGAGGAGGAPAPVAPLNAAARQAAAVAAGGSGAWRADAPVLLVCCDAGGGMGGLEQLLAAVELPVFAVRLPEGEVEDAPAELAELAMLGTKAMRGVVPPGARLVVAGVGFGGVLAHELALQLSAISAEPPLALALLEPPQSLRAPATLLSWLPEQQRAEVCQVASVLYPAVAAAAASNAPSYDAFVARLASIPDHNQQLDYVATFKPPEESQTAWELRIASLLSRLAYWQALAFGYHAADIFEGQTLLFAQQPSTSSRQLSYGGPAGAWQSIAMLVQPVEVLEMPQTGSAGSGTPTSVPAVATAAKQLQAALLGAIEAALVAEASSPEAAAAEAGGSMLLSARQPASPAPFSPPADSDTVSVVLPLNRLCPERRYILRRAGRLAAGTPSALSAPPLARVPLWLIHGETGSITGALKELASALPLPVYGLAMGGDAANCLALSELAAHYAAAVQAVQPRGPYLLVGCSISGAALAHAAAAQLQAAGQRVALLLLDGCLGQPAGLSLHDTTWYALFYLLREIGSLSGSMGDFIDTVRAAGSPTQQFKLLNSYKPPELEAGGATQEQWEAAVYATLDRASLLKRLLASARGGSAAGSASGSTAGFGGSGAASGGSSPASGSLSRTGSGAGASGTNGSSGQAFGGPVVALLPRDRLGALMLDSTRQALRRPAQAGEGATAVVHVPLDTRHTECLLSERGRQATAVLLMDAVRAVLPRL